jgi:hypothetical protein
MNLASWVRPLAHRPVIHVVLAVLLLVGAGALVTALAPKERGPTHAVATRVPVSETLVACPGLRSSAGYTESTVAAATPPQVRGVDDTAPGTGVVRTLTANAGKDKTLIKLTSPGDRGTYTGRNGERDSVTGAADGSLAPGFSVTQTERTVDGKGRGLASTQCFPTGNDFWFVGAASGVGQRAVLVLTNPEAAVATVDVAFFGRRGPIDAPGARGVEVPARSNVELRLDEVAPGQPVLALNVQVRVGRLSAALTETDVYGLEPRGTDWIPRATAPDTTLVIPGFPRTDDGRKATVRLDVVAPVDAAVVTLTLVTPEGTFTPKGVDVIEVPAGGVRSVDLTKALRGEPATVLVKSDVPVTAGSRVFLEDPDLFGDSLFLAASEPLAAPAVVPDNLITKDLATRLILTAPRAAATVTITAFAGNEQVPVATVELASGVTSELTIKPPGQLREFGLVITPEPGSGPVYGVRMLDEQGPRGPLVTSFPLQTARLVATVPVTVPDVVAGTVNQS